MVRMLLRLRGSRVLAGYLLWRLGQRELLPAECIRAVPIKDRGEKLTSVRSSGKLVVSTTLGEALLRERVGAALQLAAEHLPAGYRLLVVDAFRTHTEQARRWNAKRAEVEASNPSQSNEELDRLTSFAVANPKSGSGGHQTGGAVDVTLVDDEGTLYEMGTVVGRYGELSALSAGVPADVLTRRLLLQGAMVRAGFVNYPAEWWHYAFGDQLWAAYSRRRVACYGAVEAPGQTAE